MRQPSVAPVPSDPSERREPSLSGAAVPQPRLVAQESPRAARAAFRTAAAAPHELRAGERLVVESTLGGSGLSGPLLRKVGLTLLAVLALVGAASILRRFVGL